MSAVLPAPLTLPVEDADFDTVLQQLVVGLTGLPGNLVRPRWQPVPPIQPEPTVNWCAIGVLAITPNDGPQITHNPLGGAGQGVDTVDRHETIDVLASFYGPQGMSYAAILRDGLGVPQNVEGLLAVGMAFTDAGVSRQAPELVNQQWIRRQDIALRFRRHLQRSYAIQTAAVAGVQIFDDSTLGGVSPVINDLFSVPPGQTLES